MQFRMILFGLLFTLLVSFGCSKPSDRTKDMSYVDTEATTAKGSPPPFQENFVHNAKEGFSINLPPGWGEIDKGVLDAQSAAASGPAFQIRYIDGYQVSANDPFTHPLVMVQKQPESIMPKSRLKELQRTFKNSEKEIGKQISQNSGLSDDLDLNLGVPTLDPKTGIVWIKMSLKGVDGQQVEVLIANYYVGNYIYQFTAGTLESRSKEDWPVLEHILKTVKFDK